ncbi:hypothetical protein EUTSA_v10028127mg [Eutrema salsugineum]|uniref:Uncharacterized protein n=1 Tax=Eutrema salsugineum TaxID=72664 RepID=V4NLA7_EUTSA|nr:hypothetical protein EUTSA_v10028127mg [Eutrema salsugineum]
MTSHLPPELVEEMLSRVPAKTLSRFRSTCKRRFSKKHLDRASKQLLVLMLNEYKVSSLTFNLHGIDNKKKAAPSIESKSEFSLKESHSSSGGQVVIVFHCDGLLLCTTNNGRLVKPGASYQVTVTTNTLCMLSDTKTANIVVATNS